MRVQFILAGVLSVLCTAVLVACGSPTGAEPDPSIDYGELTQEGLAARIHQATMELEAAVNAVSTNGLTDGGTAARLSEVQAAIDATDEVIGAYANRYAELAPESMELLAVIEDDLQETAVTTHAFIALLAHNQGSAAQRNSAVAALAAQAASIQTQSGRWLLTVQTDIATREKFYANTPPQAGQVHYNRVDAFIQAHDFVDAYTHALNDKKLSLAELAAISQLAATARASLYNTGDPQLMAYAQQIDALARSAARGEWAQAQRGLSDLQMALPARPQTNN